MGRPKGSLHTEESRKKISASMREAWKRRFKRKLSQLRYNASEGGKAARSRYNQTLRGRAALALAKARYRQTPKGRAAALRSAVSRRLARRATSRSRYVVAEKKVLIAAQERDMRTFKVKYDPGLLGKEDEVYTREFD